MSFQNLITDLEKQIQHPKQEQGRPNLIIQNKINHGLSGGLFINLKRILEKVVYQPSLWSLTTYEFCGNPRSGVFNVIVIVKMIKN